MEQPFLIIAVLISLINSVQGSCAWDASHCAVDFAKVGYHCWEAIESEFLDIKEDVQCIEEIFKLPKDCYEGMIIQPNTIYF